MCQTLPIYSLRRVEFPSHGESLVGHLLEPQSAESSSPAIAFLGPVGFVKEQAPKQYATRLAQLGYTTLIFDPRYHGESSGEPRRHESGLAKAADFKAAIDFLVTLPNVDANQIYGVGICQGVNWVVQAAIADPRLQKLALIAGNYLTPAYAQMHMGSPETLQKRLALAGAAKTEFEQSGAVEYLPIVTNDATEALLPAPFIYHWYSPWGNRDPIWQFRGYWENRITRMSELELWQYDVSLAMQQLNVPTLMVHADRAATGPSIPRQLFEQIPTQHKQLVWLEDQIQPQFYEDPYVIDRAVAATAEFFSD